MYLKVGSNTNCWNR